MFSALACAAAPSGSKAPDVAPAAAAAFRMSRREGAPFQMLLMPDSSMGWPQQREGSLPKPETVRRLRRRR
jgi:hypothetical protein